MPKADDKAKLPAGWSEPGGSRKWHYYKAGGVQSLCGKWIFAGDRYDENDDSLDNCTACKKLVKALRAAGEPSPAPSADVR